MAQDFSKAFYDSAQWKKARAAYLKSVGGLCEDCLKAGIYTPAVVVHHIQELTPENIHDAEILTGFANLKAVCIACHQSEHSRHADRYIILKNGKVVVR